MPLRAGEVLFEGRRILFRNFSGVATNFNAPGARNFCVFLTDEEAVELTKGGWNVKYLKPREEGDDPQPYLKIIVKFGAKGPDPRIVLITSRGKTPLTEDLLVPLDWAEIDNADMIIRPWRWTQPGGKTGISAYLNSIYVTIREDPLERKYSDVPDSAQNALEVRPGFEPAGVIHVASEQLAITRGERDERTPF